MLNAAVEAGVLSSETQANLASYLAFRHFFSHGYAMDLDPQRIAPLVANALSVYSALKNEISVVFHIPR
ncbi:MAG: hypothetical protein C0404_04530 [Verrucomicrobia bacterium]|nr:hypothetical protein [Verrucomicrobiota bacterium]